MFATEFRPDLIRKTVNAFHANRRQPYGSDPMAGKRHAEASVRSGSGISRVPRMTQGRRAVLAPFVTGGRRAHPPKVEKDWSEKINKKEKALAFASALAATANEEQVRARGHRFKDGLTVPVVVDDDFESIEKTKDALAALEAIGLGGDIERADNGVKQRSGIAKLRGRRLKKPKGLLVVVGAKDSAFAKAAANLPGVDVTTTDQLNVERVAPGGDAGRLVVFTRRAFDSLGGGAK